MRRSSNIDIDTYDLLEFLYYLIYLRSLQRRNITDNYVDTVAGKIPEYITT